MKIAIASIGRFWLLDLARELDRLGHDTRFYSYVLRKRAERFGLPIRSHRGLLLFLAPLVAWQEYAGSVMPDGVFDVAERIGADGGNRIV